MTFLLIALLLMPATALPSKEQAAHVLNRLSFGPRPGEIERVMQMGVDRWIEEQLHPERIADRSVEQRVRQYKTWTMSERQIVEKFYRPIVQARRANVIPSREDGEESGRGKRPDRPDSSLPLGMTESMRQVRREGQQVTRDLVSQRIVRAVESERQLNEVMVDFWMNHFNVFAGKGPDRFLLTSYERDTIRPNIWGRFEDLLMATAKSPAMLVYLDNVRSVAEPENRLALRNVRQGGLNENYAREIMELHTLGVDGGYTQKDVTELARVFTGWSMARPQEGSGFVFRRPLHDAREKTVLGVRFPAGGGMDEGETMIRLLANHPSTARTIAYKLSQRFVADDPPQSLVDRVAQRFLETRGDLRETVKAVVTSREFRDPKYYGAKVKSPFEYVVSAVRAIGGTLENPMPLARELQKMGQPLYLAQPPTGYSDEAEAWVNSGALMNRLDFAVALASNKMPGVRVTSPAVSAETLGSPEFQKQ